MNRNNNNNMPQLVPFYFVNEIVFSIVILSILIYILSKYILPTTLKLLVSRIWIKDFL